MLLFLLLAMATASTAERYRPRPNILLIVLDTVRYDALSPSNTPFLDSLSKRGVLFTAAARWTGIMLCAINPFATVANVK